MDYGLIKEINQLDFNFDDNLISNIGELEKAQSKIHEALIKARMRKLMQDYGERDTDIYVVTYPKSGTTLMQMILYQMTTLGKMNFDHIYDVSPWFRFAAYYNKKMPDLDDRRIIKSHDDYEILREVEKGKFIFIVRDLPDVLVSLLHHVRSYNDPKAELDKLVDRKMKEWFDYNVYWIKNPNGLKILYLNYEDIVNNKEEVVRKIADFINVTLDKAKLNRVINRTSLKFMKTYESKFGEQPEQWKTYDNFIRKGKVGEGKLAFTDQQADKYQQLSNEYMIEGTVLGRYF